ncbi:hypothetical protein [Thalassotalea sp. G2M2-11]|uniref:hypothetical protein n=1 Tax=Thalassotalea sp. G2M2-11 TaxID=2787627 RepID=UPI0019D070AC|nr:hypothetical protein [Thalassotalea sp. G2M2-11]
MPNSTLQDLPKLTFEQCRLLTWLSSPETNFEICREIGYSYRKINGLNSYVDSRHAPFKFDTRSLIKLENENLVTSEFIYPFGMKYQRYFLTEAGQVYVMLLANSKGMSWTDFQTA